MLDLDLYDHVALFAHTSGAENAKRCEGLTPDQARHVFNIADDESWNFETCDVMPQLLTSALPGLRLGVSSNHCSRCAFRAALARRMRASMKGSLTS